MALAAALRELDACGNDNSLSGRGEVLARYRQLREISKRHHHEVLKLVSGEAILRQARRLGLARGKTLILDDLEEMNYVCDLAIHTWCLIGQHEMRGPRAQLDGLHREIGGIRRRQRIPHGR
jgi:hypothetical protein